MQGEWHRYNLKRRVAQLPAISEEMFESKVANIEKKKKEEEENEYRLKKDDSNNNKNTELTAKQLRKKQREELIEKKRKLLELAKNRLVSNGGTVKMSEDGKKILIEKKDISKEETELKEEVNNAIKLENKLNNLNEEDLIKEKIKNKVDIPISKCIFCVKMNKNLEINKDSENFDKIDELFEHLFKEHGLYLPERKYLINKEGLLEYLYEKIGFGNVCLKCSFQGKNFESIIQHMVKKDHIKIPYENEEEKLEISEFYNFMKSYEVDSGEKSVEGEEEGEEGEWEDVEEGELFEDEDIEEILYASEFGLHLPNGTVLGHRSLSKYYKQNIRPERELNEAEGTVMAAETRNFVNKVVDGKMVKQQKRIWEREAKSRDRDDRRAQKFINWQPHYRDELLQ